MFDSQSLRAHSTVSRKIFRDIVIFTGSQFNYQRNVAVQYTRHSSSATFRHTGGMSPVKSW